MIYENRYFINQNNLNGGSELWMSWGKNTGAIFIGRKANAYDEDHLQELKITRVLNCAKEIEIPDFYQRKKIKWDKLHCADKAAFPIHEWFDQGNFNQQLLFYIGIVFPWISIRKSGCTSKCFRIKSLRWEAFEIENKNCSKKSAKWLW